MTAAPTYTGRTVAMTAILSFPILCVVRVIVPDLPPCMDREIVIRQLIWQVYSQYNSYINSV